VIAPDDSWFERLELGASVMRRVSVIRAGGSSRRETVLNGLDALSGECRDKDWMLVHDAARPGLTTALVTRLIEAIMHDRIGGLLALPVADTLKREADAGRGRRAVASVDRTGLWQAQTPQMFRYGLLREALRTVAASGDGVTDEASAIETIGLQPRLVIGSARNFKVTYPDDLDLAERMLVGT